ARATAPQLAVNAAGFVALGTDDVQTASFGYAGSEFDVGAAPGHVRRDSHGAALAGARDDFRFLLVILGVEHGVDNTFPLQHAREVLADFDRNCADEHWPALAVDFLDLLEHRVVLLPAGLLDR